MGRREDVFEELFAFDPDDVEEIRSTMYRIEKSFLYVVKYLM